MQTCERCEATAEGYALWDYCAECSKNLCDACMKAGCCGNVPALSGTAADDDEEEERDDTDSDQCNNDC